jgi:molecular chaperone GrpE
MSAPAASGDPAEQESDEGNGGAAQPAPDDEAPHAAPADAAPIASADTDERYLRLAADFENFRRRKAQELSDRSRYASEDAAKALLPVLDNLRRAVAHAADEGSPDLRSGLELVVREFDAALDRLGITAIEAAGQPFDPAVHDAIAGEESDSVDVDTVATEVQRGYRLHDRVLRPALVRVAHPAPPRGDG